MTGRLAALGVWAMLLGAPAGDAAAAHRPPEGLTLPPGWDISVFADVPDARSLAPVPGQGLVFVGSRSGRVHALIDNDRDGRAERVVVAARGLTVPNGVASDGRYLYLAERRRIVRYDLTGFAGRLGTPEILYEGLPDKRLHGWRDLALGPGGWLYVAVGAPCNVCTVRGLEGTIARLPITGGRPEVFAAGVRNSVGMAFAPGSGVLYFTDNGVDWMGDDLPPEELNRADRPGLFFGFPYYGGGRARVSDFDLRRAPAPTQFPLVTFPAHNAPLGLAFFRGDLYVALHGSWNRSPPDGYRVVRVPFVDGQPTGWQPFLDGFLTKDRAVLGRPVDLAPWAGGLLLSDDAGDVVYWLRPPG